MRVKPFPWKCAVCRQKAVDQAVVDFDEMVAHDGREYRVTIPGLKVAQCRNCKNVVMTESANAAVSDALRHAAGLLTPSQIKANREKLGLTQKEMAERLGISDATLCRWETGAQIQQRSLDRFMRIFFSDENVRKTLANERAVAALANADSR